MGRHLDLKITRNNSSLQMPGSHTEEHLPWLWHFQYLKMIEWKNAFLWNYLNCHGKDPKSFVARFYPLCWIVHPRITSYSTYSNLSETFLSVVESLMMGDVLTWVPVRIKLIMSIPTTFDIVAAIIKKCKIKVIQIGMAFQDVLHYLIATYYFM